MSVFERILAFLDAESVPYRHVTHEPVRTSVEAAAARSEPLQIGGKALVLKTTGEFRLFVLSAALRLDSGAVRRRFELKRIRFANASELCELTGLEPGSIPPFGRPVLPLELYIDPSVLENERLAFNAGSLTDSLVLRTADYRRVARGEVFTFAAP